MAPQALAQTTAVGSANLRLNADNTQAILHFQYSGLGSPRTGYHLHSDVFGANPSQIIYDIDDVDVFHPELRTADGGYIWNIEAVGTLTAADIVTIIQQGKALHQHPQRELSRGRNSRKFRPRFRFAKPAHVSSPIPVTIPPISTTDAGAARFLNQATFGASPSDVAYVKANGFAAWIDNQFTLPPSLLVPEVLANVNSDPDQSLSEHAHV